MSRKNYNRTTVKKLFAHKGNLCAIPACQNQMVMEPAPCLKKKAHLRAARPNGPGYDNEERRADDNLKVSCGEPPHHCRNDDHQHLCHLALCNKGNY